MRSKSSIDVPPCSYVNYLSVYQMGIKKYIGFYQKSFSCTNIQAQEDTNKLILFACRIIMKDGILYRSFNMTRCLYGVLINDTSCRKNGGFLQDAFRYYAQKSVSQESSGSVILGQFLKKQKSQKMHVLRAGNT